MANTSERVLQLRKNFLKYHEQGWSVKQIADHYHVTPRYTYSILEEIANENGVTRESLLQQPNKQHSVPLFTNTRDGEEKVNVEKVREDFQNILTAAENVMNAIETLLEEDER